MSEGASHRVRAEEVQAELMRHPLIASAAVVDRVAPTSTTQFVATIHTKELSALQSLDAVQSWRSEATASWRELYDVTYGSQRAKFAGWSSSFTGEPIPDNEMQEWLQGTLDRIRALSPREILEIGCGTGLLATQLAPQCTSYTATDISSVAINGLRLLVKQHPELAHLDARQLDATGSAQLGTYDVVLLNSVVQYFPDVDYLVDVLNRAVAGVRHGGSVFVGDLRNFNLARMYFTASSFARARPDATVADVRARAQQADEQNRELLIAPEFFAEFCRRNPRVSGVEIQLKPGISDNELTRYRYDAVLQIDAGELATAPVGDSYDWHFPVETILFAERPDTLRLSAIPNRRLSRDAQTLDLVTCSDARRTVQDLRVELNARAVAGEDPERYRKIAADAGYRAIIEWSKFSDDGEFDVTFVSERLERKLTSPKLTCDMTRQPMRPTSNHPIGASLRRKLVTELRAALQRAFQDRPLPAISFVFTAQK